MKVAFPAAVLVAVTGHAALPGIVRGQPSLWEGLVMLTSVRLDEKSSAAGALASWRDRIHLCWVGTDTKLNLTSSPDGQQFSATRTLPHRAFFYSDSNSNYVVTAPALAGGPEHLYLSWTGTDTKVALLATDTRNFFAPTVLEHRSYDAPAVAVSGSAVPVLTWVGKNRRVNLLTLSGNTAPARLEQAKSVVAPALCGHRGALVLAWAGTDRRVNLLTLHEHGPGTHLRLEEARTGDRPAICSHQGAVLVAWTGTDRRVNLTTVTENRVTTPVRLDEARSVVGPALCSHRGRLILAWTGTDARLNVAHLPAV